MFDCVFHINCTVFIGINVPKAQKLMLVLLLDRLTLFALPCFPSVHPFASETEFKATADIVKKFQEGVGKELHLKLLQRARTKKNWVCNCALNVTDVNFGHVCFT